MEPVLQIECTIIIMENDALALISQSISVIQMIILRPNMLFSYSEIRTKIHILLTQSLISFKSINFFNPNCTVWLSEIFIKQ